MLLFLFWLLSGGHKLLMALEGSLGGWRGLKDMQGVEKMRGDTKHGRGRWGRGRWGQKWGNWCVMESAGREIGTEGGRIAFRADRKQTKCWKKEKMWFFYFYVNFIFFLGKPMLLRNKAKNFRKKEKQNDIFSLASLRAAAARRDPRSSWQER